ncbi:hypothetical protein I7I48_00299 [Histoplasma ohiense]|nr:hypothetical protein I7I48_00299 [Histoplasma ohiense (nom. inval.)]
MSFGRNRNLCAHVCFCIYTSTYSFTGPLAGLRNEAYMPEFTFIRQHLRTLTTGQANESFSFFSYCHICLFAISSWRGWVAGMGYISFLSGVYLLCPATGLLSLPREARGAGF